MEPFLRRISVTVPRDGGAHTKTHDTDNKRYSQRKWKRKPSTTKIPRKLLRKLTVLGAWSEGNRVHHLFPGGYPSCVC